MKSLIRVLLFVACVLMPGYVQGSCVHGEAYDSYMKQHKREIICLTGVIAGYLRGGEDREDWSDLRPIYNAINNAAESVGQKMSEAVFLEQMRGVVFVREGKDFRRVDMYQHSQDNGFYDVNCREVISYHEALRRLKEIFEGALEHCGGVREKITHAWRNLLDGLYGNESPGMEY